MLWALGEQSPLSVRGQSMQDMVYTGGEGVGPSRYAEVEVVLETDEGDPEPLGLLGGLDPPAPGSRQARASTG